LIFSNNAVRLGLQAKTKFKVNSIENSLKLKLINMTTKFKTIALLAALLVMIPWALAENISTVSAGQSVAPRKWHSLLDAKLSAWELWMGVPLQSVQQLPVGTATSTNAHDGMPLGLNNDPKHVFSVRMEAGEPILCISGEIFGGLTTVETYSNYEFRCQFKWGEKKWEPKLHVPRDNGILFHCTGPHGAFWKVWKRSLEFQVEEKNMGDPYLLAGTSATVPAVKGKKFWEYDPAGEMESFGQITDSNGGKVAHLPGDFEKPNGEWNTLELYTIGQAAVYVVNGKAVQVLRNLATNKGAQPLIAGQLQIQSEGAEAYYRRIEIRSLTNYPPEILAEAHFNH
jgi:hypothetical protein